MERSDSELDEAALDRIRLICRQFAGADEGELQDRPCFELAGGDLRSSTGAAHPARTMELVGSFSALLGRPRRDCSATPGRSIPKLAPPWRPRLARHRTRRPPCGGLGGDCRTTRVRLPAGRASHPHRRATSSRRSRTRCCDVGPGIRRRGVALRRALTGWRSTRWDASRRGVKLSAALRTDGVPSRSES